MASLKDLRNRIASTKATQKITKAMQMVAASKLRRAQAAAEAARPYAERMDKVLGNIAAAVDDLGSAPRLLAGTGSDRVHLIVVCTAERGLCGPFNSAIVRLARERATDHSTRVRGRSRQRCRRGLRVRARRGRNPRRASAAQHRRADFPRALGKFRLVLRLADDCDGQRHAQRRRDDQEADTQVQPYPPSEHHQGADRDHLRRRGALTKTISVTRTK